MKRMITSASLLALGAASIHAGNYAPGFAAPDNSRPWSVSATLRGFYDDNYATAPDDPPPGVAGPQSSWGLSITPSISAALSTDQTDFGARFTWQGDWYANRPSDQWDMSYIFDTYMGHTFSPRVNMYIADSFVYSSEPTLLNPDAPGSQPFRTDNNNFRNSGNITVNTQMTELLSLVLGYSNNYYSYQQDAADITSLSNPFGVGSYAALLNRIENLFLLNVVYQVSPVTSARVGGKFNLVTFTSDDPIAQTTAGALIPADDRNQRQYTFYGGVDHAFTPDFNISVYAGAQYADFYNDPNGYNLWAPWADINAQYLYAEGSYIKLGFRQTFDQTYVLAANSSSSIVYGSVNHAFTPKLTGNLTCSYQFSSYNSPDTLPAGVPNYDGESASFVALGLGFTYQFDRHFFANLQYLLDLNDSNTAAVYSYTRNRIFFGVGATY